MKKYEVLIFDLDNTLIMWKQEYWDFLNDSGFDQEKIANITYAVDTSPKKGQKFTKEQFLKNINDDSGYNLDMGFIDLLLYHSSISAEDKLNDDIYKLLDYLSKKYTLVILTNWFKDTQVKRLKKCDILKYFNEVYGCDNNYPKPDKRAFKDILDNYDINECLMIGDSLYDDVYGANNVGIDSCYFNYKNNINTTEIKPTYEIHNLLDLLKIL